MFHQMVTRSICSMLTAVVCAGCANTSEMHVTRAYPGACDSRPLMGDTAAVHLRPVGLRIDYDPAEMDAPPVFGAWTMFADVVVLGTDRDVVLRVSDQLVSESFWNDEPLVEIRRLDGEGPQLAAPVNQRLGQSQSVLIHFEDPSLFLVHERDRHYCAIVPLSIALRHPPQDGRYSVRLLQKAIARLVEKAVEAPGDIAFAIDDEWQDFRLRRADLRYDPQRSSR